MKHYKKISVFFLICFFLFVFLYPNNAGVFMQTSYAVAADDEKREPCPECPECPDPAKVVLRGLEEKRTMVEKQLNLMDQARKELAVFEAQLDEKIENFNALKKQVADDMAALTKEKTQQELEKEAAEEVRIERLVKMYAGMKPKNAAQIVDKMDLESARKIFSRMREASASKILEAVDSEKAAKISEHLAFKRK